MYIGTITSYVFYTFQLMKNKFLFSLFVIASCYRFHMSLLSTKTPIAVLLPTLLPQFCSQ